jgi:hypothetical protein
MGEDSKLDYNAIEKYLKCKELIRVGFSEEDIATFMGLENSESKQVKKWLRILSLMEEYLDLYGYTGIYTRLDKTEGQFVDLANYLESYIKRGSNIRNADWDYTESDINDLKIVCFDYIRARYEGKEFREIAKTGKAGSIFFHKELWKDFLDRHINTVPNDEFTVEELMERYPNENLSVLLERRDNDWEKKSIGILKGNLQRTFRNLEDKRDSNKPLELIERALSSLESVDCDNENFYNDKNVLEKINEINSITWDMKKLLKKRGN